MNKLLESCTDTVGELDHFDDIIDLLKVSDIPRRIWEQSAEDTVCQHVAPCDGECMQVVLGRLYQTYEYISCPRYLVLNISDWTIDKNDLFIEHITRPYQKLSDRPLCKEFPIRLCHNSYPDHHMEDGHTKIVPGSVTTREICMLNAKGYYFYQPEGKAYYVLSKSSKLARSDLTLV